MFKDYHIIMLKILFIKLCLKTNALRIFELKIVLNCCFSVFNSTTNEHSELFCNDIFLPIIHVFTIQNIV